MENALRPYRIRPSQRDRAAARCSQASHKVYVIYFEAVWKLVQLRESRAVCSERKSFMSEATCSCVLRTIRSLRQSVRSLAGCIDNVDTFMLLALPVPVCPYLGERKLKEAKDPNWH